MLLTCLKVLWASPASLLGIAVGGLGLLSGGGCQRHSGVLEFWGGAVAWSLTHIPLIQGGAAAMTLGHVVLATTHAALDVTREHERVHVRQYERWGPLFIPAYLACSAWLWCRGRDFYHDNPFEREAFHEA